jgi:hypothetical protein
MPVGDWDNISREVVSLFIALTDRSPIHMVCLDWNMVSHDFEDEDGWTNWTNDGKSLTIVPERESVSFLIFSRAGLHQLIYYTDKKPIVKHLLNQREISKFKLIKSRNDQIEIQIMRRKDFILGKLNFSDSYKLKFELEQWGYLRLRRQIIVGKQLIAKIIRSKKHHKPKKTKTNKSIIPTSFQNLELIRSKFQVPVLKPQEIIENDYEITISNAEADIKALKKQENRKLAKNALNKMVTAFKVINRCDKDVTERNKRIKKLNQQKIKIRKKPLRKLEKNVKIDELERRIEMIDRMNEKELSVKTQRVTEFCRLRETILTIRTNEEKLKPKDINLLIDEVMSIGSRSKTGKKAKSLTDRDDKFQYETIYKLVDSGNKKEWENYITLNLKNKNRMDFPRLERSRCKFRDYGYRQLIELIIESEDFLRLITEIKDMSGFSIVELNNLIRGHDSTLRAIQTFCSLLINKETRYNPVNETDFKYLNIILNSFTVPQKDGRKKMWVINTDNSELKVIAAFDKKSREWIYRIE